MSWTKFPLNRTVYAVKIYKSMQLIGKLFNNSFQILLLPIGNTFVMSQHIIYSFVTIKFHISLPIQITTTFVSGIILLSLYEVVTFPLFGAVNTKSVSFLARPAKNETKEVRKTRRGLMELGVSVGGCYVMRRHSLLTFLMMVCTTTGNLLVST